MFHSLQSRFLITSAVAYRLLVYPNLNARLKNLSMRSRYLPWYAVPQISIPYENRDIINSLGYCQHEGWFACNGDPGGVLPYMANTGMCYWTEHCQSTESRHTRHKRAIIKKNLISKNRNIHLYIIWIRTPGKFKLSFLDLITGRHNTVLV